MGHKQSKLHRQLKATDDGPSRDLVGGDGGSLGGSSTAGPSSGQAPTPFFDVKQGPFKRKLSVRNISIRRSFHKPSKAHRRLSNSVAPTSSATTDDIVIASSSGSTLNNSPFVQSTSAARTTSNCTNNHNTTNGGVPTTSSSTFASVVDGPSTSSASVSLPARAGSFSRASSSGGGHDRHVMDRIRKSFRNSFRRKKSIPESIKPHQWQADEVAVKAGNCLFPVKYLGCVEVFESRGMQICEDALRRLRNSRRRAVKGTLYVTGDGLRVVDDETKGLLVDQTIEKVSFCAPDRSHERGFSYICRDGTTRRWMCHGFHATKDSGERLSHAVGCAFAVCLERKQRRDKEAVSSVFDSKTATFTRTGSFRASSITERMQDPQVAKAADPIPMKPVHNPYAVERPHAVASLLQRQGSLRGGPLNQVSPFKRQLSLRLGIDSLPTTIGSPTEGTSSTVTSTVSGLVNHSLSSASTSYSNGGRERAHSLDYTAKAELQSAAAAVGPKRPGLFGLGSKVTLAPSVAPIQELSPSADRDQATAVTSAAAAADDSSIIAAMCQELSQGLSMLAAQTADQEEQQQATAAVFSPGHHRFSPPAATTSSTAAPFSAFDKWISTNSNGSSGGAGGKRPPPVLPPPPMVDQMPQVTAPPPPSSPPYATTVTFSPSMTTFGRSPAKTSASTTTTSTDYHSSLFSDLANSLKDNMAAPTLTQPTHTATVPPPPTLSSSSPSSSSSSFIPKMTTSSYHSSHNGGDLSATNGTVHISTFPSSSAAVPVVAATSTAAAVASPTTKADPFDADWVELSSRQVFATPATPAAAPEKRLADEVTPPPPPARAASPPALPYKSTNPFLDLSQFEAQILADTAAPTSPETAAAASSTSPPLPPQPPAAMQMITAFEVQM